MFKKSFYTLGTALLVSLFIMTPSYAMSENGQRAQTNRVAAGFTEDEVNIIIDVLDDLTVDVIANDEDEHNAKGKKNKNKQGLPPGLAKRDGDLPPGLEKQLERNGTLPSGLAKRDLPPELRSRLPIRRDGKEIVIIDDDVVLIETATNVVVDILADVVRGGARR